MADIKELVKELHAMTPEQAVMRIISQVLKDAKAASGNREDYSEEAYRAELQNIANAVMADASKKEEIKTEPKVDDKKPSPLKLKLVEKKPVPKKAARKR